MATKGPPLIWIFCSLAVRTVNIPISLPLQGYWRALEALSSEVGPSLMRKLIQREIRSWFSPPLKPVGEKKIILWLPWAGLVWLVKGHTRNHREIGLKVQHFIACSAQEWLPHTQSLNPLYLNPFSSMQFRNISINSDFSKPPFSSSWKKLNFVKKLLLCAAETLLRHPVFVRMLKKTQFNSSNLLF